MKKIKIILCVLAAILLISLIVLIATKNKTQRNIVINNPDTTAQTLEITNYTTLSRVYKGQGNISNFNSKVRLIAEDFLPEVANITKNMDSKELKEYFDKNKSEITKQIGIEEFSDFQNLITSLRSTTNGNIKIKTIDVDLSNYIEDESYAKFTIVFINENNKKIEFNAFLNMKNNPSRYIKLIPAI